LDETTGSDPTQYPAEHRFEAAVDAIVRGDLSSLRMMLRECPSLVRERSARPHRSTLLHYVSANGVENERQITPPNVVDIARLLIDAGAPVDVESEAYGGRSTTLGLTATSAHPRIAGVQIALMDLLIDRGAKIGAIAPENNMARAALSNGCPAAAEHLIRRGASSDDLYGAAGLGQLDVVRDLFDASDVTLRESALLLAAQCRHASVAVFLLNNGVSVHAYDGMTALHWAAATGDVSLMERLVAEGAELERHNSYGGTVLSSAIWFAFNAIEGGAWADDYVRSIDWLVAAGSRTDVYAEMMSNIEWLRRAAAPRSPQDSMPSNDRP